MINVLTVVGARPQFIKAAAVSRAFDFVNRSPQGQPRIEERILHTGQHYDDNMSKVFFDQLNIPRPHINLGIGSGPHGAQTGKMLAGIERVLMETPTDWVLVYGDTNSTLAAALAAVKLHVPVAHVESGMRSFNRRMPEEINRIVADCVSTILFCPTDEAERNHAAEGVTRGVHKVGDVMFDSVLYNLALAERTSSIMDRLALEKRGYFLATVHRAENTDDPQRLSQILSAFREIDNPIVWPVHPRTRSVLGDEGRAQLENIRLLEPVSYLDMLMLEKNAKIILTDSGGVQKEAYWLGIPCVTLRDETEWVELVESGCNRLAGADARAIVNAVSEIEAEGARLPEERRRDLYGDGHSAAKIARVLLQSSRGD